MNGWMEGGNGWMESLWIDKWIGRMEGWRHECRVGGWMDRWMNEEMDGGRDEWRVGGWMKIIMRT